MIKLKSKEEIKILREGGRILAQILFEVAKKAKPGVATRELDWLAENSILKFGGEPAFKNYQPAFNLRPFPASLCVSVNNTIVHGIPGDYVLVNGDVVKLDLGMKYEGLYTDMAITIGVGNISSLAKKLIRVTKKALSLAIKTAQSGATLGDIGFAIQNYIRSQGFYEIQTLTGHGVGYAPHEEPDVFNYGIPGKGIKLKEGMVIAIEPMVAVDSSDVIELPDGSFVTKTGCLSAHFEHTIAITERGPLILTK
ncbi:MAG: type I methionyl aminopeptidase [Patescibacteria group bacterium]|jgi:methionyl aminopeptidase|nr:type I methionyl aminopeptidase [Patescibacteria group bacterium]